MKTHLHTLTLFSIAGLFLGLTTHLSAATIGLDAADDVAYNSGWTNGSDGGTAATFGAWALTSGGANAGQFIGSSIPGGADINTGGESFGLFGHSGQEASAERDIIGGLSTGQIFSMQISVNFRNGFKGFAMESGGSEIFTLNIGADTYTVSNAATGNGDLPSTVYDSNTIFTISLAQTSAASGSWTVARSGGLTPPDAMDATGTYSGTADRIRLYIGSTDNGDSENNLFANNLSVVPEPSAIALLGLGLMGLIARRRR